MAEAASAVATSADTAVRAAADVAAAESEELEREMAAAANAIMAAGAPGSAAAVESRTSADGSSEGVAAAVAWRTTKSCPSFAACLGDFGVPCSAHLRALLLRWWHLRSRVLKLRLRLRPARQKWLWLRLLLL
jgi:hypothetical protein